MLISSVVMIVKNMTTPLSRTATITVHRARGRISRSVTEMPMTSSASSSSRILRAPMSEQIAEPATPESISAVMIGEAWRTTARVLPAPVKDTAPTCWASTPTWSARITPNGIETISAGRVQTRMVYQVWSSSSSNGNRRREIEVTRSEPSRESSCSIAAVSRRGRAAPRTRPSRAGTVALIYDLPGRDPDQSR